MESKAIDFTCQARYYCIGKGNSDTRQVWFVCHGYGQLAQYFIRHFQGLDQAQHYVIAPEGLHRFYLQSTSGRVGASWMTKEDRERDIANYLRFLSGIYIEEISKLTTEVVINFLGFSQGAATVSRLAMHSGINFDRLILWAGVFPPDLSLSLSRDKLAGKSLEMVYGLDDPYITAEGAKVQEETLRQLSENLRIHSFQGKHELNGQTLQKLANLPF